MKSGSLYSYSFNSDENVEISAGDRTLQLSIAWPDNVQEIYDNIQRDIDSDMRSDPLVNSTEIIREYDYLGYYSSIPAYGSGMEEWLDEQDTLPQSIRELQHSAQLNLLVERRALCLGLSAYLSDLKDQLCYQITITDDMNRVVVTDVRPGGWFNEQDNYWAIRYTADIPEIGQGQLNIVTMEIEVYDNDSNS